MVITGVYIVVWVLTLAFGIGVVATRRADHAAFSLMGVMIGLAANFLLMGFLFIGFLQLIVYIGAIMVLFLFVIMLLNLREPEEFFFKSLKPLQRIGLWSACAAFALMAVILARGKLYPESLDAAPAVVVAAEGDEGAVQAFAAELMERWLLPFEVVSLLLLAAVIGAIYIARQRPLIFIDTEMKRPAEPAEPSAS